VRNATLRSLRFFAYPLKFETPSGLSPWASECAKYICMHVGRTLIRLPLDFRTYNFFRSPLTPLKTNHFFFFFFFFFARQTVENWAKTVLNTQREAIEMVEAYDFHRMDIPFEYFPDLR
jgi:hypothetical protein